MSPEIVDRIVEMAWEDRTPFDAIKAQFQLSESAVRALMRKELKRSSYILWRKRVENSSLKHLKKRIDGVTAFKSNAQRHITLNKLSKR
ncbi:MAG: TIGR03643 family protein [Bacteroidetes bacterium]|nr:TIGR03643 family protein [Bacteroidota bacterium]MBM3425142.1 TIGR03643 family protein [Bacteroidota bacterium]